MAYIDLTADISESASIDPSVTIWHLAQIRERASIGAETVIGRGAYIGPGVVIGRRCKVQNFAMVYETADLSDGVFVGPGAVLTNDKLPRAVNPDLTLKVSGEWQQSGVTVLIGASIGANAVCVSPVQIGRWAMVAAGSVVVRDVPDFAIVAGVPARRIGWVGPAGQPLVSVNEESTRFLCPRTGQRFRLRGTDQLEEDPSH